SGRRSNYDASLLGIWCSKNAWASTPTWAALPLMSGSASLFFSWYAFDLLVDAGNPNVLYLAEQALWRYASGSWTNLTGNSHADHHAMAWVPSAGGTRKMLLGNDGGVWLSAPGVTTNWQSRNSQLAISQLYKGAVDPSHRNRLTLAGVQDNFTVA